MGSDPVEDLRRALAPDREEPACLDAFDDALAAIEQLDDPALIERIMELLDDEDAVLEGPMWTLIHMIEWLGRDDDYAVLVEHLLIGLPAAVERGPDYARTLVIGVLDSSDTLAALHERLPAADESQRAAARQVLERLADDAPEFKERVDALLRSERS